MDWTADLHAAALRVDAWIAATSPAEWLAPRPGGWSDKDLLGHLTAWSDLLMDQVEALRRDEPETIEAIDVDAWNAAEVASRRGWTIDAMVAAWRRSVQRTADVIARLPPDIWARRWRVAWAPEPICIADVLRLWLVHLDQHRSRLGRSSASGHGKISDRG